MAGKKAPDSHGISAEDAREAVRTLLKYVGENCQREGLVDTPDRFCRALLEMTSGYEENPEEILKTTFGVDCNETVLLKNIEFQSMCEHHLLNFQGRAHVAYVPSQGRVVGLSKLARLVDLYANRLQIQERMTQEIGKALEFYLAPNGVAVMVEASHSCMCVRGVKKNSSRMCTTYLSGVFRESHAARQEFMSQVSQHPYSDRY